MGNYEEGEVGRLILPNLLIFGKKKGPKINLFVISAQDYIDLILSKAALRSAIKSAGFSKPIDTRTKPSEIPSSSRRSKTIPECVVEAG
jgi:hypothetical protein